jgi:hypothetical protein
MMKISVVAALGLLSLAACSKPAGSDGAASKVDNSKPATAATAATPNAGDPSFQRAAGPTKLPTLGLQVDVPGEVIVSDGLGKNAQMLSGPQVGGMNIAEASDTDPKTVKDEQSEAQMFTPKNLKTETLPDGWAVTFENTGSMGTNYWVEVRRNIGTKSYICSGTEDTADKAQGALTACKSIKPAS